MIYEPHVSIYEPCEGMKLCGGSYNLVPFYGERVTDECREKDDGERVMDEGRQKVDYVPCSTTYFDIIICDY